VPSLLDLTALPPTAVRRRCPACGWDWIARLPQCPRCAEDRVLALPMRRVGWVPSEAGPDQLELFGWAGEYLGAAVYRRAAWQAFTPSGPVLEHPRLDVVQRALEEAVAFRRPAPERARWETSAPPPRARVDLVAEDGRQLAACVLRTGRWWCLLGDEAVLVAERPTEDLACRWVEELLGVMLVSPRGSMSG